MNIFRWRQRQDAELDAELQSHLDAAIRDRIEPGETAEQARANGRREFGNVGLVKEVTREMWGWFFRPVSSGMLSSNATSCVKTQKSAPGSNFALIFSVRPP